MFSLSRKKSACLAGILMLSGAAAAEETTPVVTPAVPAVSTPAPVVTAETAPAVSEKAASAVTPETAPAVPEKTAPAVTAEPAPLTSLPTAEATVPAPPVAKEEPKSAFRLDSEEQKRAYASGVAMARYIEDQIEQQKALHITLDKDIMLAGIADTFNKKVQMSDRDIQTTLAAFDEQVKVLTKAEAVKKSAADKAFLADFTKQDGVKKTKQGLLYLVKNKGQGEALKDTDTVEVSYQGKLVDGTIVDGPQVDNSNQLFRVANMPPVLRDSVKLIRKGGEVQVVIPPATVENADNKGPNVVVIYTISVVDVNKIQ